MYMVVLNVQHNEPLGLYYPNQIRAGIAWKKLNYLNKKKNKMLALHCSQHHCIFCTTILQAYDDEAWGWKMSVLYRIGNTILLMLLVNFYQWNHILLYYIEESSGRAAVRLYSKGYLARDHISILQWGEMWRNRSSLVKSKVFKWANGKSVQTLAETTNSLFQKLFCV